jgi:hypothetical protein
MGGCSHVARRHFGVLNAPATGVIVRRFLPLASAANLPALALRIHSWASFL